MDSQALDECLRKRVPSPKLPGPSIIAIRAIVACVAMSDAAEHREAVWRDDEEIEVLASDGSTSSRFSMLVSTGHNTSNTFVLVKEYHARFLDLGCVIMSATRFPYLVTGHRHSVRHHPRTSNQKFEVRYVQNVNSFASLPTFLVDTTSLM